jgi:hypothetical protein
MKNPFLEEIWASRQRIARRNGYNLRRTVEYLRGLEADYPGRVMSFKPRSPDPAWLKPLPRVRAVPRRRPAEPAATLREEPPPYGGSPMSKAPKGHRSPMRHESTIEEIWRIRDQIAAECGYDVSRLFKRLREEEAKYKDRLVSFAPRKAAKPVRKKRRAAAK